MKPIVDRRQAGFSLIELAIVLIILGIITGFSLPLFSYHQQQARFTTTKARQEAVFYSLSAYLLLYNTLPCPADPYATGVPFGQARLQCADHAQAVGIVPFRTLGLPEEMARDGFKRFFTYAVDPEVTSAQPAFEEEGLHSTYCSHRGGNRLVIQQATNVPFFQTNHDFAVAIVISHGEPGFGAFLPTSRTQIAVPANHPDEQQNSAGNLIFVDRPYSTNPLNPFQHIVKWVSHKNLPAIYGHTPCRRTAHTTP